LLFSHLLDLTHLFREPYLDVPVASSGFLSSAFLELVDDDRHKQACDSNRVANQLWRLLWDVISSDSYVQFLENFVNPEANWRRIPGCGYS
jgi:hypothetical protein